MSAISRTPSHHQTSLCVMVCSGIALTVSGVALGMLVTNIPTVSGNFFLTAWGIAGGISLVSFAVAAVVTNRSYNQTKNALVRANQFIEQKQSSPPPEIPRTLPEKLPEKITADVLQRQVIEPILTEFAHATKSLLYAYRNFTLQSKPHDNAVDLVLTQARNLLNKCFTNKNFYLKGLLSFFCQGSKKQSVALRRLITAHNSQDPSIIDPTRQEYEKMEKAGDFNDLITLLKNNTIKDQDVLAQLPTILEKHFFILDDNLEQLGKELIHLIFNKLKKEKWSKQILEPLKQLRREANSIKDIEGFSHKLELFLRQAFDKAQCDSKEIDPIDQRLAQHIFEMQFPQTLRLLLGMFARNMLLFPKMFNDKIPQETLFTEIDKTFLLSESGDCLSQNETNYEQQEALIAEQARINQGRDAKKRIALLLFDPQANIDEKTDIVQKCLQANPHNCDFKQLQKIANQSQVKQLANRYKKQIIVVPASFSDHFFKEIKSSHGTFKNFVARAVVYFNKPKEVIISKIQKTVYKLLPALEEEEKKPFEQFINNLVDLFFSPFFEGAISNKSPFRQPFQQVIAEHGTRLAESLEKMLAKKELSYEKIRSTWAEAAQAMGQAFSQKGNKAQRASFLV